MGKIFWDGRLKIREAARQTHQTSIYKNTQHHYLRFHDIFHDGWIEYFPDKRMLEIFSVEDRPYLKQGKSAHATSETIISLDTIKSLGPIVNGHVFNFKYVKMIKNITGVEEEVLLELIFEGSAKEVMNFWDTVRENCPDIIVEETPNREVFERVQKVHESLTPAMYEVSQEIIKKADGIVELVPVKKLPKRPKTTIMWKSQRDAILRNASITFIKNQNFDSIKKWKCELCDVITDSEDNFISHYIGIKHKKREYLLHNQDRNCSCENCIETEKDVRIKPTAMGSWRGQKYLNAIKFLNPQAPERDSSHSPSPGLPGPSQDVKKEVKPEPMPSQPSGNVHTLRDFQKDKEPKEKPKEPKTEPKDPKMEIKEEVLPMTLEPIVYNMLSGKKELRCQICDVTCGSEQFYLHAMSYKHRRKCTTENVEFRWGHLIDLKMEPSWDEEEEKPATITQESMETQETHKIPENALLRLEGASEAIETNAADHKKWPEVSTALEDAEETAAAQQYPEPSTSSKKPARSGLALLQEYASDSDIEEVEIEKSDDSDIEVLGVVQKQLPSKKAKAPKPMVSLEPELKEEAQLKRFCGICKVGIPKDTWDEHVESKAHKTAHFLIKQKLTKGNPSIMAAITYDDVNEAVKILEPELGKWNKRRNDNRRNKIRRWKELAAARRLKEHERAFMGRFDGYKSDSEGSPAPDEAGPSKKKRKNLPGSQRPLSLQKQGEVTTSSVRDHMADPSSEVLHCDICDMPIGDERMMEAHERTRAHKHMAWRMVADSQANDILIGKWHNRISHREYWYAHYWIPPTMPYFCNMTKRGDDTFYNGYYCFNG